MILLFAIPIDEARDTSIFIIVLFSCAAFISYLRQGKIDIKISLIFATFALMGSVTASIYFLIFPIDNYILKLIIASIVRISGINMIAKAIGSYNSDRNNQEVLKDDFSFENYDINSNLKKNNKKQVHQCRPLPKLAHQSHRSYYTVSFTD